MPVRSGGGCVKYLISAGPSLCVRQWMATNSLIRSLSSPRRDIPCPSVVYFQYCGCNYVDLILVQLYFSFRALYCSSISFFSIESLARSLSISCFSLFLSCAISFAHIPVLGLSFILLLHFNYIYFYFSTYVGKSLWNIKSVPYPPRRL